MADPSYAKGVNETLFRVVLNTNPPNMGVVMSSFEPGPEGSLSVSSNCADQETLRRVLMGALHALTPSAPATAVPPPSTPPKKVEFN